MIFNLILFETFEFMGAETRYSHRNYLLMDQLSPKFYSQIQNYWNIGLNSVIYKQTLNFEQK